MNVKHTILAFVILLALGGAFYFLNRQPEKPSADAIPKEDLFSFTPDQVEEFSIEAASQPPATFRRLPTTQPREKAAFPEGEASDKPISQWEITTPQGIAADHSQIQMFLEELPGLKGAPLAGEAAPVWSDYGLDQPEKTYRFKLKDGKEVAFSIGKQNPAEYARYARRDNSAPVLLVDNIDDKSLIEKALFDLRDKRILPVDINQATRLEVRFSFAGQQSSAEELAMARELGLPTRSPLVVMTKQANGNWDLDEPRVRTDHGATGYLLSTLSGGLMKTLEAENSASLAPYGLNQPQIRVDVTTPSGKQSLLVGRQETKGEEQFFYARNTAWPHIFTILRTVYDQLNQDKEAYRERYLFDFDTTNATRVEIQGPSGEWRFGRRGEEWFMAGAPETKMAELKVDNFLNSIHSLRVSTYTTDQPNRLAAFGLDKPWMRIKVGFSEKNLEETVLFARRNNKFYAARQGEPSVYELSPTEPENLESKLQELTAPPEPASGPAPAQQ